jgi:hypothetical protein
MKVCGLIVTQDMNHWLDIVNTVTDIRIHTLLRI